MLHQVETSLVTPVENISLTLSRRRPLSYRNQSIDLLRKSMDWFLYDNGLRHERVNGYIIFHFSLRRQRLVSSLIDNITNYRQFLRCEFSIFGMFGVRFNFKQCLLPGINVEECTTY